MMNENVYAAAPVSPLFPPPRVFSFARYIIIPRDTVLLKIAHCPTRGFGGGGNPEHEDYETRGQVITSAKKVAVIDSERVLWL